MDNFTLSEVYIYKTLVFQELDRKL